MHVYRMWRKGSINEKTEKEKCKRRINYVLWCDDDGEKRRIMWSLVEKPATITANLPHVSLFREEEVLWKGWSLFSAMSTECHCSLADDHHCRLASLAAVWHRLAVIREQRVLTCRERLVEGTDVHCTWLGMAVPDHKGRVRVEPWDELHRCMVYEMMGENCSLN